MKKTPTNSGKVWTPQDIQTLKDLIRGNTPTPLIAYKMGRSESSIRSKCFSLGLSLSPTNKSPYNRRKS